ncbi:type IV pilus assembly protein PilX [Methylomarinovum tepidoasis]|uniref:Type IV pilus assembly protein PilX n=1 Tax=Methylomarinovum tepidoasis TaxID=2840183 RepID=A0AAU9D0N7_9GAMM|nr:PilX N-terminal domain-containing pilus assembly protein [Methylomarinovum sp. IN45]BCX88539.1 type IV pilus assembly protein PilX [Methylomarinovum sp. IN45]
MKTCKNFQTGAALIVSLMMLLVMTVLGVAAMQTNLLEEKMAGNFRDHDLAFQAAEMALRNGEGWLSTLTVEPAFAAEDDFIDKVWKTAELEDLFTVSPWWEENTTNPFAYGQAVPGLGVVQSDPVRVIERVAFLKDGSSLTIGLPQDSSGRVLYRITSQGTGGTATAKIVLQSIYAKRF